MYSEIIREGENHIMPCDYKNYPENWFSEIRPAILERANNCCEFCSAENHQPHPVTGSKVVLTIMHLDHDTSNNDPANLKAGCQRCHNRYDAPYRAINRKKTRRKKQEDAGQLVFAV